MSKFTLAIGVKKIFLSNGGVYSESVGRPNFQVLKIALGYIGKNKSVITTKFPAVMFTR